VEALLETALEGLPKRSGKVRDVYDLGDRLLLVATDRISAFDRVMPNGIPDKGRVLTGLSAFWFQWIGERARCVEHHMVSTDIDDAGLDLDPKTRDTLVGRSMIARKCEPIPFECVVRGYLEGSGWKEYKAMGSVCGGNLPGGLVQGDRIDPIFTPATKAESGHDENISFGTMANVLGFNLANQLGEDSLDVYRRAAEYARSKGLILADTKFEWGHDVETGELLLIDEVLTPDSSRYWDASTYRPGGPQPSFDKQFVRDWLETSGWDKQSPPPKLPDDVVAKTRQKYIDAYERLTGQAFPWK
jgi:phosphoribosylaminoimidazole-succinocarboxamide synthase